MGKELLSADAVLERIGATSFRNISKDQLITFVSAIPEMDKEIAIKCIEQFPAFKEYAASIVSQLQALCMNAISDNKASRQDAVNAYMLILEGLREKLSASEMSASETHQLTQDMVEIADKIALLDAENKRFLEQLMKIGSIAASLAIAAAGAILGLKVVKKD